MKDDPLTKCPKCKKKKLNRLLGTGAGLLFKGSGFYITDYGKDGKGPRKAPEESAPKSESKPEKSEAPAPKPEPKAKPAKKDAE